MIPTNLLLWLLFGLFVIGALAVDLGVFQRRAHLPSMPEAAAWCGVWVGLALLFNVGVLLGRGRPSGLEFFTGYLIEWSLSVDNLFVFLVLFRYFAVPPSAQPRVLKWGILGAAIMRGTLIAIGTALIQRFHWMLYIFGAFLVITGIKLAFQGDELVDPGRNPVVRACRRFVPLHDRYDGERFFTRQAARALATPLLLVLVAVETTDFVFALDSIPAIFGITTDPFIVFTSNMFAVLGLRALFFLLANIMGLFRYLKVGLAIVLCFIGVKMLVADFLKISIEVSLGVVGSILALSVLISVLFRKEAEQEI